MYIVINKILVTPLFQEYCYIIPIFLNFIVIWFVFFCINAYSINNKRGNKNIINKKSIIKVINNIFVLNTTWIWIFYFVIYFILIKGDTSCFWWFHLTLNNFIVNIFLIFFLIIAISLYLLKVLKFFTRKINYNFYFALTNIIIFLPYIYISNSFFSFFFILELGTISVFYKFVSSRVNFSNSLVTTSNITKYESLKLNTKNYLNILFFNYWSTFFSSVIFIYIIITFIFYFNTSEWMFIHYFLHSDNLFFSVNFKKNLLLISLLSLIAFFIKTGITPLHLYKIEIYKGLPYSTIFMYNTFYFLFYFIFFILFFFIYFDFIFVSVTSYIYALTAAIILYTLSLMFNLNYLKAFFAYSTTINSLLFVFIILTTLN